MTLPPKERKCKRLHISYSEGVLIVGYLSAGVIANLAVYLWGQVALVLTAAVLLPLDFLARDILHRRWEQRGYVWILMPALILSAAVLTYAINPDAQHIAMASAFAIGVSGTADATYFALLRGRSPALRMNASNAVGALVDSILFPMIAFGSLSWSLSLSQAAIKLVGGLILSSVYLRKIQDDHSH